MRRALAAPVLPLGGAVAATCAALVTGNEWLLWGSVGVLAGFSLSGSV
jgi:fatty acid desaturase